MTFDEFKEKLTPKVRGGPTCSSQTRRLSSSTVQRAPIFSQVTDIVPQNPSRETSPNRGSSLPQEQAIPDVRKPLRQWQAERNIDRDAQIKLRRLVHMRYQHPDLAEITTFLRDFGMSVAKKTETQRWFKGYGRDQYVYYAQQGEKKFLGGTFEVESFAELEK